MATTDPAGRQCPDLSDSDIQAGMQEIQGYVVTRNPLELPKRLPALYAEMTR